MGEEGKERGVIEGEKKSEKELSSDKNAKDTEMRRVEGKEVEGGEIALTNYFVMCTIFY